MENELLIADHIIILLEMMYVYDVIRLQEGPGTKEPVGS